MQIETYRGTAEVARLLAVPEWRLHDVVRRGEAAPLVVAGRRLWSADDVARARAALAGRCQGIAIVSEPSGR